VLAAFLCKKQLPAVD